MSNISGMHRLNVKQRREAVAARVKPDADWNSLDTGGLTTDVADRMIENVIGIISYPVGVATNFLVNGKDVLVPMSLEEPSVVAAASKAAKIARAGGGFQAKADEPVMIGTVQLVDVKDVYRGITAIMESRNEILKMSNEMLPEIIKRAGGVYDFEVKPLYTESGNMLVFYFYVHVLDAMGANTVDTVAEGIAPFLAEKSGGKYLLRILSNYALKRIARATARFPVSELGGEEAAQGIIHAYNLARADVFRAVTHNKGIMNGIIAVANTINNDTRAIEAGAHAYAARSGRYMPLTDYRFEGNYVVGRIELPLQVATFGGSVGINAVNKVALNIMNNPGSRELAEIMASVGLAQNFAAMYALVTEGIQSGHMKLHAKSLAISAGANVSEVDEVAGRMVKEKTVNFDAARKILEELRKGTKS